MRREFTGVIVEESLEDNRLINSFEIVQVRITNEEDPQSRWHLYTVTASESEIDGLSTVLKPRWYAHFWKGTIVIVIFRNKRFLFELADERSREAAVTHGMSLGIPRTQLNFPID